MIKMTKMVRRLLGFVLLITFAGGCAAAPQAAPPTTAPRAAVSTPVSTPAAAKLEKVKIQISSLSIITSNIYVGREKGLYKQEGLDVEIIPMKATLVAASLASGEVDYSIIGSDVLYAGLRGAPVKALMVTVKKPLWYLVGGTGVNSPADLKGKVIGVNTIAGLNYNATKKMLATLGVDPDKDVTFVAFGEHAQLLAALKAGSVGAISTTSPYNVLATQEGFKQLTFMGDFMEVPIAGFSTSDRKIKDNRDQAKRAVRGTLKAMAYMRDNPKETTEYLMKLLDIDERIAKSSYEDMVKSFGYDGTVSDSMIEGWLETGRVSGAVPVGNIDVSKGLDRSIVEEVKKELKL